MTERKLIPVLYKCKSTLDQNEKRLQRSILLICLLCGVLLASSVDALRLKTNWKERVDLSEKIVRGQIIGTGSYWNPEKTIILTDVTVIVNEYIKGNGPIEFKFTIPGGKVGEETHWVSDTAQFRVGDYAVILFDSSGQVTGGPDGVYLIQEPIVGQDKMIPLKEDRLLRWIRAYVARDTQLSFEEVSDEVTRTPLQENTSSATISGVSPPTISAGTGDVLTITGGGFGPTRGFSEFPTIGFRYRDSNYMFQNSAIRSWSDSQIQIEVWTDYVDNYLYSPGSWDNPNGTVAFINGAGFYEAYYPLNVNFGFGLAKWSTTSVPYYVNLAGAPAGALNAIQAAANTWSSAGANLSFNYAGSTTKGSGLDGENTLSFADLGNNITIGIAFVYETNGVVTEADIQFNTRFPWSTDPAPPTNKIDLQNIAVHELGHWLQLTDLYGQNDANKVMFGLGHYGSLTRNLSSGDEAGIRWIYPSNQQPNLMPYKPQNWEDKIVVSISPGTNTEVLPLYSTDSLYVDWTVINRGSAPVSSPFYTGLYVDGVLIHTWETPPPVDVNQIVSILDYPLGSLSPGSHTIKIVTDSTGVINETNEGDNEYSKIITVRNIPNPAEWTFVTAGYNHSLALKSDGTLWGWGGNNRGQLGIGTTNESHLPVQIGMDNKWSSVSTRYIHSIALKSEGTLWAWGANENGQLGDGTIIDSYLPKQIGIDSNWATISAGGNYTIALKSNGTLWAWGTNEVGQLGDGTTTGTRVPKQIGTDNRWILVAAGISHTLALKSDGTLWGWGHNESGQLGDGTTTNSYLPKRIGTDNRWVAIAAENSYSLALKSDGTLWAWGMNSSGQFDCTFTDAHTPRQIGLDTNWVAIAAGAGHSLALKPDGTLWAWGANDNGRLGDGTTTDRRSPKRIGMEPNWTSVSAGGYHTLALKSDGTLWAWGYNEYGQLGDGTMIDRYLPAQIGLDTNWNVIAAGSDHSLALKSDGTLWAWGANGTGQLGDGTTSDIHSPKQIGADNRWTSIAAGMRGFPEKSSFNLALKSDGTLWAWGHNGFGQLGDGTTTDSHLPKQIGTDNRWVAIAAGWHSLALKSDGTLWAWGMNSSGQFDCTFTDAHTPRQIGLDTNWVAIAAGASHSLALKPDGTLWAWGGNGCGQLGNGTTDGDCFPKRIGRETNWATIAAGSYHSLALKSDGTLWAWGDNGFGQLGDGTTTDSHSPKHIGADNRWASVSAGKSLGSFGREGQHSVALKSNGTLWAWGYNGYGELGDGTLIDRYSPIGRDTMFENVTPPTAPTGPINGNIGITYSYSTGNSTSSLGHTVEYQLEWKGDGSDLSAWGPSIQSKNWSVAGTYNVRARARCTTDTSVISDWSPGLSVLIFPPDTTPPDTQISSGPSGTITYNNPSFTYTGTDNVTPTASLVYATYLQGYDSGWSNFSSSTSKSYSNLPNGSYTFQVKAKDQAGNEDPSPATQSFTVAFPNRCDFNGDGKTDILWRNKSTGQNVVWLMNGTTYSSYAELLQVTDTNWEIVGTGDFNGDGKTDILWRNKSTGQNVVWYMNGAVYSSYTELMQVTDTNWQIVGTGDFNSDGKTDILWRNKSTGQDIVWYMNGATYSSYAELMQVTDTNWQIVGTGDFNSDGMMDILWRNRRTGENGVWFMDGTTFKNWAPILQVTDTNWQIVGTGDFNSDGKVDILWRNKSTGQNIVWFMNGAIYSSYAELIQVTDTNWEVVGPK